MMQEKKLQPILSLVAGAVLVLFPYSSVQWLMMVLGVIVLIYGISCLNDQGRIRQTEGIIAIAAGLFLLVIPRVILGLVPFILGILALLYGISQLMKALQKRQSVHRAWMFDLAVAVLVILLGLFLLRNPLSLVSLLVKVVGLLVIYGGVSALLRQNQEF